MKVLTINTVQINSPIAEVYKFVINMENFKHWFPGVIEIKSDNYLGHGIVGKTYSETVKIPFKGEKKITLKVVQSEENELFITEGTFFPLMPRMVVKFSEDNNKNTSLTWSMQSRNESFIFNTLFLPLLQNVIKKRARIGVQNLKKILENNSHQDKKSFANLGKDA
jgi:carbon monoxide dehydrogenase subunit G